MFARAQSSAERQLINKFAMSAPSMERVRGGRPYGGDIWEYVMSDSWFQGRMGIHTLACVLLYHGEHGMNMLEELESNLPRPVSAGGQNAPCV